MSDSTRSNQGLSPEISANCWWEIPDLKGAPYHRLLKLFHDTLRPRTYLEIGVYTGGTLSLANCAAIGIDPNFRLDKLVMANKPLCFLFNMTSDNFFATYDPCALFRQHIEMAFLDGMHLFEFLLRDFINTEAHCRKNSVVLLHDCIPLDSYVGRRKASDLRGRTEPRKDMWAGDVWKVAAILKKHRPELKMYAWDAVPTGLVAVTNLDAQSTVLRDNYFDLIEEYGGMELHECGEQYIKSLNVLPATEEFFLDVISRVFWL